MKTVFCAVLGLGFLMLSCCSSEQGGDITLSEAWDFHNRPSLFNVPPLTYDQLTRPEALEGSLPFKPWRDNYWPFVDKSIARRYMQDTGFASFAEQRADAATAPFNPLLSPSEKYDILTGDDAFSLSAESWSIYERLYERYGEDYDQWNWMGLCSGWAPASISEPEPRSHVAARTADGREVLFFNGDIRALLSKAYDMNGTEKGHQTIGLRCDEPSATFARDEAWRIIDGQFSGEHRRFTILADHGRDSGVLEVAVGTDYEQPLWLVAAGTIRRLSGPADVWVYQKREDVIADLAADTRGERAMSPEKVQVVFFRGCRDVNPASLHAALAGNLSGGAKEKKPFVIEMTRAREVWNQPLWGFTSKVSAPVAVTSLAEREKMFRALRATHIVEVETSVIYATGGRPSYDFPDEPRGAIDWDAFHRDRAGFGVLDLKYSLELDANGLVIGGEWDRDIERNRNIPDFFWRNYGRLTDMRKDGRTPSLIKYSVVGRLSACSQQTPDAIKTVEIAGQARDLHFVTCDLQD